MVYVDVTVVRVLTFSKMSVILMRAKLLCKVILFWTVMSLSDFPLDRRKQLLLQRRPDKFDRRFRRRKIWALDRRRPEPGSNPSLLCYLRCKGAIDLNFECKDSLWPSTRFYSSLHHGADEFDPWRGRGKNSLKLCWAPKFFSCGWFEPQLSLVQAGIRT